MGDWSRGNRLPNRRGGIEEEEENLVVLENVGNGANNSMGLCLIGKLWMDMNFNMKAFIATIGGVWQARKKLEICELGKNLLIFQFESLKDKQGDLDQQQWHFDRNILVLKEIKGDGQSSAIM